MFVIFDIGGILTAFGVVAALAMLFATYGISGACIAFVTFIEDYADIIGIVLGVILLILAIGAFCLRSGSIVEKLSVATGEALAASQFLFGMVYGIYQVASTFKSKEGHLISMFFFFILLVVYIVIQVVNTLLTGAVTASMVSGDNYNAWYNIGSCVLGIVGWIFQATFWTG